MTKGRRFFIFLSSAGIMTFFLLFTLSVREDKPLEKYMEWLPNNRVISMILERKDAQNKSFPKRVDFLEKAQIGMTDNNLTQLEVLHALKSGDVEFSHDSTKAQAKPKQYYVLIEVNEVEYYVLAQVHPNYSDIIEIGIPLKED